jgi:hypothetical protein
VAETLRKQSPDRAVSQADIRDLIDRVVIGRATIQIQLLEVAEGTNCARILTLPWTRPSPYRKREVIQGANDAKTYARPMRANARAILIEALGDAHRWLDELLSDPRLTLESIASREDKTERSIRMTLSLAFLAPEIVKAAVEGRLPRGFGLKRLVDLPMTWPDQWRALGTPGASTGVRNDPPPAHLSSSDGLIHPSRTGSSLEVRTPRAFEIGRGGHVANSNLGNGILRPETFGETPRELALRIAGPPTETDPWRGKLRKCRAILWRRKSRRFARTTWWS